jgi:ubiquitin-like modifier-activating enzyme ATG7
MCNEKLEIKFLRDVLSVDELESNLKDANLDSTYFCFSDPSAYENPGWSLRNFVFMLLKLCPVLIGKQIKVISVRQDETLKLNSSLLFTIDLSNASNVDKADVKWTGWEKNKQEKLAPKMISMKDSIDPVKQSEHFSNFNLKLMKWSLVPNLDLDIVKSRKCLIFGSGTLGCAISRNLLSWGVTDITLIDSGNVSASNPVRQCLFTHDDAVKHKPKATTAAERLKLILPSVNATGQIIQVPMPGHSVGESMRVKTFENLKLIKSLIEAHDVMFLVTDSRESRWLPTLLGAFFGKVSTDNVQNRWISLAQTFYF